MSLNVIERTAIHEKGIAGVSLLSFQENHPHTRAARRAAFFLRELRTHLVDS
jgi:hypothetical protein